MAAKIRPKGRDPNRPGMMPFTGQVLFDSAGDEYRITSTTGCALGHVEVVRVREGAGRQLVRVTRMLIRRPAPPAAAFPALPAPPILTRRAEKDLAKKRSPKG